MEVGRYSGMAIVEMPDSSPGANRVAMWLAIPLWVHACTCAEICITAHCSEQSQMGKASCLSRHAVFLHPNCGVSLHTDHHTVTPPPPRPKPLYS